MAGLFLALEDVDFARFDAFRRCDSWAYFEGSGAVTAMFGEALFSLRITNDDFFFGSLRSIYSSVFSADNFD